MNDNRVPAGSPEGGQWASGSNPESLDVSLGGAASFDGSFRYPPPLETADEVIDFWQRCPVDDEVMDHLRQHCAQNAEQRRGNYVAAWERENPRPSNANDAMAWTSARQRVIAEACSRYPVPNRGDLRTLARLNQMVRTASVSLVPDQQALLDQHKFTLPIVKLHDRAHKLLDYYGAGNAVLDEIPKRSEGDERLYGLLESINLHLAETGYSRQLDNIENEQFQR